MPRIAECDAQEWYEALPKDLLAILFQVYTSVGFRVKAIQSLRSLQYRGSIKCLD
jgi:hypothetical protein